MNHRRKLVIALGAGAFAAPIACFAQPQRSKVARIGVLESTSSSANQRELLITGLRELGYVEGKNIIIEDRWAEGQYERLPDLAAELVKLKVDVIVAAGSAAVQAAKQATTSIPIVMVRIGDPVGSGFVASLGAGCGVVDLRRLGGCLWIFSAWFVGHGVSFVSPAIGPTKRMQVQCPRVALQCSAGLQACRDGGPEGPHYL